MGHTMAGVPDSYMDFGAGQFIVRTDDGYIAASDPRATGRRPVSTAISAALLRGSGGLGLSMYAATSTQSERAALPQRHVP